MTRVHVFLFPVGSGTRELYNIGYWESCHFQNDLQILRNCRHENRYCFYSPADFWVFRPTGTTRYTDQGEICQGGCQILPFYESGDPTNSVKHWGTTVGQSTRSNL